MLRAVLSLSPSQLLRHSCSHSLKPKPPFSSLSFQYTPWSGHQNWRDSPLNNNRFWGPNGPEPDHSFVDANNANNNIQLLIESTSSLAELGVLVLSTSDPLTKSKISHLAFNRWYDEKLPVGASVPPSRPARSSKPELVLPKEIPTPKHSGLPLNAYMLHNLAHVELNAIDLAWDTVVRFSSLNETLGEGFFVDFAHVADDESRHISWCSQRLAELSFKYGDMPAHNLLWRECEKSSDNVTARLAAIPLLQTHAIPSITSAATSLNLLLCSCFYQR